MLRSRNTGQTGLYDWDATKALEDMDKFGVATSVMSVSEPGVHFGDDMQARALARDCNDYAAKLMADHPGRFGLFAILPLPDVDGALKEIEYAYDTLKADGIAFMTSYPYPGKYQGNKYLGDPLFVPVMQELNRRKAICYTQPFRAEALINTLPDRKAQGFPLASDTTLTILSILENETAKKFPTSASSGRTAARWPTSPTARHRDRTDGKPNERMEIIKRYYDTAQLVMPWTLNAFTTLIPNSQVLFGSDYLGNADRPATSSEGLKPTRASRRSSCARSTVTTGSSCFRG